MTRVLIGAPVRQRPEIFQRYLEGLRGLRLPKGVTADKLFVLHNSSDLTELIRSNEMYVEHSSDEDYVVDQTTHRWRFANVEQVTVMKNGLLEYTRRNGYDYFFLVDSDLILHPETLAQLLSHQVDLIANVFWTSWQPDEPAGPNAWDYDGYTILGDNLERWKQPGCYEVGMSGACILISRKVIEAGVTYARIPNLTRYLFPGEDRHFCIRAACHGFRVWLETTYPATHLYRLTDLENSEGEAKACLKSQV